MAGDHFLKTNYGLTPAEIKLAQRLLAGDSLRDAAERLDIGYETARTRLKFIFQKTGVRRQAELLLLLLRTAHAHGTQGTGLGERRPRRAKR